MLLLLFSGSRPLPDVVAPDPGSAIVAGTFSKGQWHNLKTEIAAKRAKKKRDEEREAARLEAQRQRDIERIAAEIAARHAAEDAAHAAKMRELAANAPAPATALQGMDMAAAQVAHANRLAQEAALARAQAEEEEALAALML